MSIEAMKQALEALYLCQQDQMYYEARKSAQLACSSLRAAIAQAEQESVRVDLDKIAAFCRVAFGYGAADFNAGVDAVIAELKIREKNTGQPVKEK